jgi:hypothetical protein
MQDVVRQMTPFASWESRIRMQRTELTADTHDVLLGGGE